MYYASRKDQAHALIANELRVCGFCVVDLSRVGAGCPDLLVSKHGVWALVELKTPKGAKTALERLSAGQHVFHSLAKGPIITAYTASEIRSEFALLLKRREAYAL